MILPGQRINNMLIETCEPRTVWRGFTYGRSAAGYDIRIAQNMILWPGRFVLASSIERFAMPRNLLAVVHDKSTHIRRGLTVGNTVLEPGWQGWLTLELKNASQWRWIRLRRGQPIAQVVFHMLAEPAAEPYSGGKYDNQPDRPVPAIMEPSEV